VKIAGFAGRVVGSHNGFLIKISKRRFWATNSLWYLLTC